MLKILHIIPDLRKGGAERLTLDICIELSKREGIDARIVILYDDNEYAFLSKQINYKYIPTLIETSIIGKSKIKVDELVNYISEYKPDIIHSHLFEAEIAARCRIFNRVAYISHCHDKIHQLRKISSKIFIDRQLLADAYDKFVLIKKYRECNNSFISVSPDVDKYLRNVLPQEFKSIFLLPNAINIKKFSGNKSKSIRPNEIRLISVGRLDKNKNHTFLLDVVKILVEERKKDVFLTLVGKGDQQEALQAKAENLQISSSVNFAGRIDNVEDILVENDIYVHSALSEAMGLTIIEAMASGLPVVSLNGGGNENIIEHARNGYIFNKPDAMLFADTILTLIENECEYDRISRYAKEFSRKFDIVPYVDSLLKIYLSLLK
jgi:glycosyltransferase involved in cell wall biosynthesis